MLARNHVTALISILFAAGCGSASDTPPTDAAASDAATADGPAAACSDALWSAPAGCTATDLEGKLRCIPGLEVTPRTDNDTPPGYQRFDLVLTQPIDHAHPEAGTFGQRAMLLHTSDTAPMVLATSGYQLSAFARLSEPTRLLAANQIAYEHRFFLASRPVPTDWTKLDIQQAAGDAHALAAALHWLYPGRWVNTGGSKGGMTSVYQRRFHPCDVDATVAYVAPTSLGTVDPSYVAFLDQVGGADRAGCRADLVAFQRRLLEQRAAILPMVEGTFTQIPVDEAYELAALELNFAFWQYTSPDDGAFGCSAVPGAAATPAEMLAFLEHHSSVDVLAGDGSLDFYHAYYHQAASQLGGPAPYERPLADLLQFAGKDVPATYLPAGEVAAFDGAAMPDVNNWVASEASQMMFIYGSLDPWSSREFAPSAHDSHVFVVEGGNHGSSISQLADADRSAAHDLLARWLNAPVVTAARRRAIPASVLPADRADRRPPR